MNSNKIRGQGLNPSPGSQYVAHLAIHALFLGWLTNGYWGRQNCGNLGFTPAPCPGHLVYPPKAERLMRWR